MAQRYSSADDPNKRRTTAQLFMADQRRREPAKMTRARARGTADQMGYEMSEKLERDAGRKRMEQQRRDRASGAAKMKAKRNRDANQGTMGGTLRGAFFGR